MSLDSEDWLLKKTPAEWLRAGSEEATAGAAAVSARNFRAALTALRRAAGMALNGALIVEPNPSWGRTYVEHLQALAKASQDTVPSGHTSIPPAVVAAAQQLMKGSVTTTAPSVLTLRTPAQEHALVEAARDIIAHAYTVVVRHGMMP
jgi:hypothetical protein